jgi:tRNA A37 threonylcarbamoyladenosine dehydratase
MGIEKGIFNRTSLLTGEDVMQRIADARVIIFGLGGVGSWCAESLVRSGISNLTLVDSDRICVTNINRQLQATTRTVGQVKTDALMQRLIEINPHAKIVSLQKIYSPRNAETFQLEDYDYIVDAIDSLENKVHLIQYASTLPAVFFSSMGAALKIDPTRISVAPFWKVTGCPLAAALRRKLKKAAIPVKNFLCVYSPELLPNRGAKTNCGTEKCLCPKAEKGPGDRDLLNHEWCSMKAQINGTVPHITAIFGFTLAGLILKDIYMAQIKPKQNNAV